MSENILEADHLTHYFKINKKIKIKALDDVSFQIRKWESQAQASQPLPDVL